MTTVEHDIVAQVYAAKEDSDAADNLSSNTCRLFAVKLPNSWALPRTTATRTN